MKIQRGFFFFKSSLTGAAPASWRAFLCSTRAFVRRHVLQIQAHTPTLSRLRAPTHLLWSPSGASRRLHYRRHRARVHCAQAQVRRARASCASIVWHVTHPNRADTACTRAIPAAAKSKQVTLPFFPLPRVTNHCAVWLNQCSHTVAELQRRGRQLQRACAAACTRSLSRSCPRVQYTRRFNHALPSQVVAAVDRDFSSFGEVISSFFADKNSYVVHLSTLNNQLYSGRLRCNIWRCSRLNCGA